HVAHIIAQLDMLSDYFIGFDLIYVSANQYIACLRQKYLFIPVYIFNSVFDQTIGLWFKIKMKGFSSAYIYFLKVFSYLDNVSGCMMNSLVLIVFRIMPMPIR